MAGDPPERETTSASTRSSSSSRSSETSLFGRLFGQRAYQRYTDQGSEEDGKCSRTCSFLGLGRRPSEGGQWPAHQVMAEKALFSMLSFVPCRFRSSLMGLATGTRGSNVVFHNEGEPGKVALTIDDAPSRSAAQFRRLLDLLSDLRVRVTFQVISGHASSEEHLQLLRRAVAEGHQLTNHTTMDAKCIGLTEADFEERLNGCQAFLEQLAPGSRLWFRPPMGVMDAGMRSVLLRKGYSVCLGDCYSSDPHIDNPEYHVRTLLRGAEGGSVLIVHCPEDSCRQQTLEVVPQVVAGLRARGLELVTLDELFPQLPPRSAGSA